MADQHIRRLQTLAPERGAQLLDDGGAVARGARGFAVGIAGAVVGEHGGAVLDAIEYLVPAGEGGARAVFEDHGCFCRRVADGERFELAALDGVDTRQFDGGRYGCGDEGECAESGAQERDAGGGERHGVGVRVVETASSTPAGAWSCRLRRTASGRDESPAGAPISSVQAM